MNTTSQPLPITFIVGDVFQDRNKNLTPLYFGDNFKKWFFEPNKDKMITITSISKLKLYVLPRNMSDGIIQKNLQSTPMDMDTFWTVVYCLIVNPKFCKELLGEELSRDNRYVMHVQIDNVVYAFNFLWDVREWGLFAAIFNDNLEDDADGWHKDRVYLYL